MANDTPTRIRRQPIRQLHLCPGCWNYSFVRFSFCHSTHVPCDTTSPAGPARLKLTSGTGMLTRVCWVFGRYGNKFRWIRWRKTHEGISSAVSPFRKVKYWHFWDRVSAQKGKTWWRILGYLTFRRDISDNTNPSTDKHRIQNRTKVNSLAGPRLRGRT